MDGDAMTTPTTHRCAARGCTVQCPATLLMCGKHWRLVPSTIQARIYRHYRKGQTIGTATTEYLSAMHAAIDAVAAREGRA